MEQKNQNVIFSLQKQKGQHLLKNPLVIKSIIEKSGIRSTDVVLEVGPGTGNLTQALLDNCKQVIAIEVDPRMAAEVQKRFRGRNLTLICADVLKVELPFFDLCVSNIPYSISSPLIFKLLAHQPRFRAAVLMLQREFAMRLLAKPGSDIYCRLSVNVQLLSRVDHLMKISKNSFKPPPKVDSSVVRISPKAEIPPINLIEWDGLLRICFIRKNKTLGGVFKKKAVIQTLTENIQALKKAEGSIEEVTNIREKVINILTVCNMVSQRANKLDNDDFLFLLNEFNKEGFHFA